MPSPSPVVTSTSAPSRRGPLLARADDPTVAGTPTVAVAVDSSGEAPGEGVGETPGERPRDTAGDAADAEVSVGLRWCVTEIVVAVSWRWFDGCLREDDAPPRDALWSVVLDSSPGVPC